MSDLDLTPRTQPEGDGSPRRRRKLLPMIVLALVLVAGGVIVTQFLSTAVDYFCNVDEVGERSGCEAGRPIRLQGTVDPGTISEESGLTTFTMSFRGARLPVEYTGGDGRPGGIFDECQPVVVHGEIRDGVMYGDNIEVKHSNEYEAANPDNIAAADADVASECGT